MAVPLTAHLGKDAMQIVGPFWKERATTSATEHCYGWCYFLMDSSGNVVATWWLGHNIP